MKLWNHKEITTTLTTPGTVRTAVGRDIWSKILRKTSVKKLINKRGYFKDLAMSNRKPIQFLSTGVILVYLLVFDMILAALFWMHYNLRRLNLERLLKSELQ